MSAAVVAGIELGGTKCVCLLAEGPERVLAERRIATTTPDETLGAIAAQLAAWRAEPGFAALGIGSFGPLDLDPASPRHGFITATPKPGWRNSDVADRLARTAGVPTAIDTDVTAAALAEGRWGAAQGLASFAYITVGTGIGAGLIVGGRPVTGLGHPEAGHLRVGRIAGDAWPGACPFHGDCVEGLASGPAIARRAGRPADELASDDPAWAAAAHALAGLCHNLVLTVAPQRILIGGGVALGQPQLLPLVREMLVASLAGYGGTNAIAADIDRFLMPPALGSRAGPLGAIALGLDALRP